MDCSEGEGTTGSRATRIVALLTMTKGERMRKLFTAAMILMLAACAKTPERRDTTSVRADTAKGGMAGMGGMMSGAMMDSMQMHMRMMDTMSADHMKAMMATEHQMMSNMLAQMDRQMQSMRMGGDAAWTALIDSVRQDIARMPEMNAQQLKSFMPAHHERVMRLMQRQRDMMSSMKR